MTAPTLPADRLRLASVEITRRCHNACPYCDQPKSETDMPAAQFAILLDELVREGFAAVALGGGEPTLHPALPTLLKAARERSLRTGLTTNARDPGLVIALAGAGLLDSFGVSAGKGTWTALAGHRAAVVNLLLLAGRLPETTGLALEALKHGSRRLLLLGYKGDRPEFAPTTAELASAFTMLTALGRRAGATVAADDYTRRRLGLSNVCGEGFLRVTLEGTRDRCCFPMCEYRMIPALVLAAGLSRRMGQFKLLLPWADRTVIGQVVATLEAAGVEPIVVVAGHRAAEVETALAGSSARIVLNQDYASGEMLSSIQAGLRAVEHSGAAAALLCLGDQPQMAVETVKTVLAAGGQTRWAQVVIPSFQMRGGHPILLPRSLWAEILSARGTLRDVLARHRDQICYIPVDTPGVLADLDTPEDYAAARLRTGSVGDRPERDVSRTGSVGDRPERDVSRTGSIGDRPERDVSRTGSVGDRPERDVSRTGSVGAGSCSLTGA